MQGEVRAYEKPQRLSMRYVEAAFLLHQADAVNHPQRDPRADRRRRVEARTAARRLSDEASGARATNTIGLAKLPLEGRPTRQRSAPRPEQTRRASGAALTFRLGWW